MPEVPAVTIVMHDLHPYGGQERATYELARRLLEQGVAVTVIARRCELPGGGRLRWIRIRGPRRPFFIGYLWFFLLGTIATAFRGRGFRQAAGAIVLNRMDAITVHCCHQGYSKVPAVLRRGRSSPLHTLNSHLSSALSRWAERICFRPSRVETLVSVSAGAGDELRRSFPRMASRVRVIPNGVDAGEFHPDPAARAAVRSALGLAEKDLVAVFVGGAWMRKGGPIAWAGVAQTDRWHLLVAGCTPSDIEAFGRDRDPEAKARLHLSPREDWRRPARLYAAADAFVFPTSYESFSLATLEAAAAGLPLLISRVHGSEELVVEGETGFFVDRTPESVGRALDALADDTELRRRMGDAARRVAKGYTWESTARMYEALYAGGGSAAAGTEQGADPAP